VLLAALQDDALVERVGDELPLQVGLVAGEDDPARPAAQVVVTRFVWRRCRSVGNATGQASKAWWNARRWGGTRPD